MKSYSMKSRLVKLILTGFFSAYALVCTAQATKEIMTLNDFKQWAEAKALCQKTSFTTHESDDNFIQKLQSLNLKVESDVEVDDESGLYGGSIKIKTPVTLFGFNLKEMTIYMGSGQEFNIVLETTPQDLVALVKRHQLDKYPANKTSEDYLHLFYTSKPTENAPWGSDSQGVIIKNTEIKSETSIGCWQIDG